MTYENTIENDDMAVGRMYCSPCAHCNVMAWSDDRQKPR